MMTEMAAINDRFGCLVGEEVMVTCAHMLAKNSAALPSSAGVVRHLWPSSIRRSVLRTPKFAPGKRELKSWNAMLTLTVELC